MVIVAAVDRSDNASTVVREADILAQAFEDVIHVVHVITPSESGKIGRSTATDSDEPFDPEEEAKSVATDAASGINSPYEEIGLIGDPSEEIINYADEQGARYIVVASEKQSRTGKVLLGSVAQSVLLNASSPVVIEVQKPGE